MLRNVVRAFGLVSIYFMNIFHIPINIHICLYLPFRFINHFILNFSLKVPKRKWTTQPKDIDIQIFTCPPWAKCTLSEWSSPKEVNYLKRELLLYEELLLKEGTTPKGWNYSKRRKLILKNYYYFLRRVFLTLKQFPR